jgi:hypothetical protein
MQVAPFFLAKFNYSKSLSFCFYSFVPVFVIPAALKKDPKNNISKFF